MKKLIPWALGTTLICTLAWNGSALAEPPAGKSHRVVFEVTSGQLEAWSATLNNVEHLQTALPGVQIEVVAHGKGLSLLVSRKNAAVRERLKSNAARGVVFAACENALRKQNVKKADLVEFAITVDSGVAEVVRKQEAGWSYIRSGS